MLKRAFANECSVRDCCNKRWHVQSDILGQTKHILVPANTPQTRRERSALAPHQIKVEAELRRQACLEVEDSNNTTATVCSPSVLNLTAFTVPSDTALLYLASRRNVHSKIRIRYALHPLGGKVHTNEGIDRGIKFVKPDHTQPR